jgi:release factor glutamine methyltransferase
MTILDWLVKSMRKLNGAGVDSPRRDCLVLIEDLLGKDRSWVNAHAEYELSDIQLKKLNNQIKRRVNREPLAYIRGKAWFYGRFFAVSPSVMMPRPESESFIGLLKDLKPKSILDVGTGSGCLAITARLELPEVEVTAIDSEQKALEIAKDNAKKYKANIQFLHGSLLEPLLIASSQPEAIITNLPYVPEGLITSPEINHEPETALFSGKEGLGHYKEFWAQVKELPEKPRFILTESLENQHEKLSELAEDSGYKLTKTDILVQQFELTRSF